MRGTPFGLALLVFQVTLAARHQAPVAPQASTTQTFSGFEFTVVSFERTNEWRPLKTSLTAMVVAFGKDKVEAKPGFEFALARVNIKLVQPQKKEVKISGIHVVDATGSKHPGTVANMSLTENWGDRTEEFAFEIKKSTPTLVKLTLGNVTLDLDQSRP